MRELRRKLVCYAYSSRFLLILSIALSVVSIIGGSHVETSKFTWMITSYANIGIYGSCIDVYCVSTLVPSVGPIPLGTCNYLLITVNIDETIPIMLLLILSIACSISGLFTIKIWHSFGPLLLSLFAFIFQLTGFSLAVSVILLITDKLNKKNFEGQLVGDSHVKFGIGLFICALSIILQLCASFCLLRSYRLQRGDSKVNDDESGDSSTTLVPASRGASMVARRSV